MRAIFTEAAHHRLEQLSKRHKKRSSRSRGIIGPVYRAQPKSFDLHPTRPTYWAETIRATAFGTYIIKAKIRLRNPYEGEESQARDVAMELNERYMRGVLDDEGEEFDPEVDDSVADKFAEVLADEHTQGIWQARPILAAIQMAGYDGVISWDPHGGTMEYVVFSTRSVKVLDTFRAHTAKR